MIADERPHEGDDRARLRLLGSFALDIAGRPANVPSAGQRVIALLALHGGNAHRSRVAGLLWPDQPEARALSNLRAALWRLPTAVHDLVTRSGTSLAFHAEMLIDLHAANELTRRLLDSDPARDSTEPIHRELLMHDLLPTHDDEWLVVPRERHRQRRLHALEALAESDLRHNRALDAVDTALAAVAAEPLRESAQLLVVRAHLAAGNRAAALEHFRRFKRLLASELAVEPSPELLGLVNDGCGSAAIAL